MTQFNDSIAAIEEAEYLAKVHQQKREEAKKSLSKFLLTDE